MATSLEGAGRDQKLPAPEPAGVDTTLTSTPSGEQSLTTGIHVVTSVFLVVTGAAAAGRPLDAAAAGIAACVAFGFAYFFGSSLWRDWPRGGQYAWLAVLTVLWLALMTLTTVGVYLVITLYFVYMRVFDDWRGILAVAASTALSIAWQIPNGLTPGAVLGPASAALVVVAIYYAFRAVARVNVERQRLIDQLVATRGELADTQRRAGVAAERERIAHEIHDTVAQGLSSIQMLLYAADRDLQATGLDEAAAEPVARRMAQARRTAAENLAEARAMIAALQPAALTRTSLESALRRVAESFAESGGVGIDVDVDGDARQLPMTVEAAILRIAQGALGNVVKHADASACRVTLGFAPDELRLDVVDNGKGFDPEDVAARVGHVGLDAIRRRAADVGGELSIESRPGGPTALSVAIPAAGSADEE
ncbi:sensor histidine kinase [Corynebacterium otitidis]|uniref:sensor histidine kinase n=1 Tax=Corynebacterium otitidis TaxID=29321 RepID=UPI000AAA7823|nr:sensor histidine kinase [Corynebacterium otitidis]